MDASQVFIDASVKVNQVLKMCRHRLRFSFSGSIFMITVSAKPACWLPNLQVDAVIL